MAMVLCEYAWVANLRNTDCSVHQSTHDRNLYRPGLLPSSPSPRQGVGGHQDPANRLPRFRSHPGLGSPCPPRSFLGWEPVRLGLGCRPCSTLYRSRFARRLHLYRNQSHSAPLDPILHSSKHDSFSLHVDNFCQRCRFLRDSILPTHLLSSRSRCIGNPIRCSLAPPRHCPNTVRLRGWDSRLQDWRLLVEHGSRILNLDNRTRSHVDYRCEYLGSQIGRISSFNRYWSRSDVPD